MTPTQAIDRLRKWHAMAEWTGDNEQEVMSLLAIFPLLLAAVEAADRAKTLQAEYFRACALAGDELLTRTQKQYRAAASAWSAFDDATSALARKVEEMDNA